MHIETVSFAVEDGMVLKADRHGPEDGPPVMLLHGGGQTRWSWKGTAKELAGQGLSVYNVDLRGHGQSSWSPSRDYALDAFARDIRAIAGKIVEPPVIVGASLGGMSALLACGEEPFAPCAGLVLVDVAFQVENPGSNRVGAFMKDTLDGFADLEDAATAIARYSGESPQPGRTEGLRKILRQNEAGRYYWHWDPAFIDPRATGWDPAATEARMISAARRVKYPLLAIRGGNSDVVSREALARLAQMLPQMQHAEIPGARHMVAADDNAAFNMAIMSFIESCVAGSLKTYYESRLI